MRDAKENREEKLAARNPGGEKNGRLDPGGEKNAKGVLLASRISRGRSSRPQDLARPFFSPPGFRATIIFLAVFFRVTHYGLSERGTTRSLSYNKRYIKSLKAKVYHKPWQLMAVGDLPQLAV